MPSHQDRIRRNYDDYWWEHDQPPQEDEGLIGNPGIYRAALLLVIFYLLVFALIGAVLSGLL